MSVTTNNGAPSPTPGRSCTVIWDFDGTLVDSRQKNLSVTRLIIEEATGKRWQEFEALQTMASYAESHRRVSNWRFFYAEAFGMTEDDIDRVGGWWSEFQLDDDLVPPAIEGVPSTLEALSHLPHGIVSMNGRRNIESILESLGLGDHFDSVIGYEEVGMSSQKPDPEGLLKCIEHLTDSEPGVVFFIGDHVTDTECAARARVELQARGSPIHVVSIRAAYGPSIFDNWHTRPDHIAHHPEDVVDIIQTYMVS